LIKLGKSWFKIPIKEEKEEQKWGKFGVKWGEGMQKGGRYSPKSEPFTFLIHPYS
jgi:hypothetical protein